MFTKKEKSVWIFILSAAILGLIVGAIRNELWFTPHIEQSQSKDFIINDTVNIHSQNHRENTTYQSNEIININTANKAELMTLPKVGQVTAERIIRYREEFGEFQTANDIVNVKGIGPKTFEKLKKRITTEE